ncbi:MAG: thioredoxin family protein [bacterium]|nr:thioredoxin family protein [Candidatus Sumerlaeota bacterium]
MSFLRCYFLAFFAVCMPCLSPASVIEGWFDDWNSASSAARHNGRPLLVMFAQEGCHECERMTGTLAASQARAVLQNAVKVRLECYDNPQLMQRFNVSATPTIILLSPSSGFSRTCYREVGALGVSELVELGRTVDSLVLADASSASERPAQTYGSAVADAQVGSADPKAARAGSQKRSRAGAQGSDLAQNTQQAPSGGGDSSSRAQQYEPPKQSPYQSSYSPAWRTPSRKQERQQHQALGQRAYPHQSLYYYAYPSW